MKKVRIDKWLWSVRIYKTRSLSSTNCRSGKVKINEKNIKPSLQLQGGEVIEYRKNGFTFTIKVLALIDKRVSATFAAPCYEDITPPEELLKYETWFVGKGRSEIREKGAGRPTKRERRELSGFKGDFWEEE